jgi:hypothetical protein
MPASFSKRPTRLGELRISIDHEWVEDPISIPTSTLKAFLLIRLSWQPALSSTGRPEQP